MVSAALLVAGTLALLAGAVAGPGSITRNGQPCPWIGFGVSLALIVFGAACWVAAT